MTLWIEKCTFVFSGFDHMDQDFVLQIAGRPWILVNKTSYQLQSTIFNINCEMSNCCSLPIKSWIISVWGGSYKVEEFQVHSMYVKHTCCKCNNQLHWILLFIVYDIADDVCQFHWIKSRAEVENKQREIIQMMRESQMPKRWDKKGWISMHHGQEDCPWECSQNGLRISKVMLEYLLGLHDLSMT